MTTLEAKHLDCYIEQHKILSDLNLTVDSHEFVGILGPNGCGKSTLIHHLARILPTKNGEILLNHKALNRYSNRDLAKEMAVVNQIQQVPFEFKVHEVVEMGRFPHKHLLERDNQHDAEVVEGALRDMGMLDCYYDNFYHLSGGQQQRVLIAKALAQETKMILLDEPTNHLDIQYQIQVFDTLKDLDVTVLTALHDLNMASLYCDKVYVLNDGTCYKEGHPQAIIDEQLLHDIFGVRAHVYHQPFAISYK